MARRKQGTRTNIEAWHRQVFRQIANHRGEFVLFSCFVDGEPTAAIASMDRHETEFIIRPMFVAVTPKMTITDHKGTEIHSIN